jgi:hypothetical protein
MSAAQQTATATASEEEDRDATVTVSATPRGTATPDDDDDDGEGDDGVVLAPGGSTTPSLGDAETTTPGGDGDGFPIWAAVLLGAGALAAIGGGVGYYIYRTTGPSGAPPAAS